jgi:hypothetical protein
VRLCGLGAEKEPALATKASEARSSEAKARAEASFKKDERAREGAKAMMEYHANSRLVGEKTARLRALRLAKEAKEAADKEPGPAAKLVTKKPARGKS